jgi:LEA14-like dessication related protein
MLPVSAFYFAISQSEYKISCIYQEKIKKSPCNRSMVVNLKIYNRHPFVYPIRQLQHFHHLPGNK